MRLVCLAFLAALPFQGVHAATVPVVDCNSLDACLKLMAQAANPPATEPYGLSAFDEAIMKKVQSYGPSAIPGLLALANDPHLDVASRAGAALENIQGLTAADVPAILDAARHGNGWIPGSLGLIDSPEAISALMDLVKINPEEAQESQISLGLERQGAKAVPYLVAAMRCKGSCDEWYMYALEHILAGMPKGVKPDPAALTTIVSDTSLSEYSRRSALMAIRDFKFEDPATAKAVVQTASEPGLKDDALDALVAMQSPEAIQYLVTELHQGNGPEALGDIARLGEAGHDAGADVLAYLDDPDWDTRVAAAAALGNIGYLPAVPKLMQLGQGPNWMLSFEAVRSLGMMHAKEAKPMLENVAHYHWFIAVRDEAEKAIDAVDSGAPMEQSMGASLFRPGEEELEIYEFGLDANGRAAPCNGGTVRWHGQNVAINGITTWPHSEESPKFTLPDYATGVMRVQGGWLVGRDKGEFGGGLYAYDDAGGRAEILAPMEENVHGIYNLGGTLVAVAGIAHMIIDHGRIYRLEKDSEGKWQANPLVQLPGVPGEIGVLDDGHLVINTEWGPFSVDQDGQMTSLECVH